MADVYRVRKRYANGGRGEEHFATLRKARSWAQYDSTGCNYDGPVTVRDCGTLT
jgi:hypothetical protein